MSIIGKHLTLILFILFISGCVSKAKVHVYAKYLSEHEKQSVSQKIEELGFIAVFNEFGFPTNITDSSIIYSPLLRESNSVNLLVDGMNVIGININSVVPLVSGNHWYTNDSIALFLITGEENLKGQLMKQDLSETYKSRGCEKSIELTLYENGNYELAGEHWTDEQQLLTKGTWEYRQYPYVELRPVKGESWYRYYEVVQIIENDKVSEIELLELVPLQTHQLAGDCRFAFGMRLLPIL